MKQAETDRKAEESNLVCVCVFMRDRENGRFISNCICCRGRAEGRIVRRGEENQGGGRPSDNLRVQKSQETVAHALDKRRGASFSRRQERSLMHVVCNRDPP